MSSSLSIEDIIHDSTCIHKITRKRKIRQKGEEEEYEDNDRSILSYIFVDITLYLHWR